jgi:hypothetical protein
VPVASPHGASGNDTLALTYSDFRGIPDFLNTSIYSIKFVPTVPAGAEVLVPPEPLYADSSSIEINTGLSTLSCKTPALPPGTAGTYLKFYSIIYCRLETNSDS